MLTLPFPSFRLTDLDGTVHERYKITMTPATRLAILMLMKLYSWRASMLRSRGSVAIPTGTQLKRFALIQNYTTHVSLFHQLEQCQYNVLSLIYTLFLLTS